MTYSSADREIVIQDQDGYREAVERLDALHHNLDREHCHGSDDIDDLETEVKNLELLVEAWEREHPKSVFQD